MLFEGVEIDQPRTSRASPRSGRRGRLPRLSRRDRLRLGDEALLSLATTSASPCGRRPRNATLEFEAVWSLCPTLGPSRAPGGRRCRSLPDGADAFRDLERPVGPAERGLGAGELLRAERLPVRLRRAGLLGRAKADGGLARDHRRAVRFLCPRDGAADRLRIVAVDARGAPTSGLETLHLVDRIARATAVRRSRCRCRRRARSGGSA